MEWDAQAPSARFSLFSPTSPVTAFSFTPDNTGIYSVVLSGYALGISDPGFPVTLSLGSATVTWNFNTNYWTVTGLVSAIAGTPVDCVASWGETNGSTCTIQCYGCVTNYGSA
jgi:hypothetical protein